LRWVALPFRRGGAAGARQRADDIRAAVRPGRIQSIVNIQHPSIRVHPIDKGINTVLVFSSPAAIQETNWG
jgi:hypothetical protein